MKKSFVICLLVLLWAVSLAFAEDSPLDVSFDGSGCLTGGVYFHLACNDVNSSCTISQESSASPSSMDFACWDDLVSVLEADPYVNYSLVLGTSLNMGGYDEGTSSCKMEFSALSLNHGSLDGGNNTVYGFCQKTSASAGFFVSGTVSFVVENVTFSEAHVEGGEYAGVIGSHFANATFNNVKIDGAKVIGDTAGTVAGSLTGNTTLGTALGNVVVRKANVQAAYAGGALTGTAIISVNDTVSLSENNVTGRGSLGGVVGVLYSFYTTANVTVTETSVSSSETGDVNIGGFAGLYTEADGFQGGGDVTIEKFGFQGTLSGTGNVGGIVGQASRSSSNLIISNTYSNGDLVCSGAENCGFIVGSATTSNLSLLNNYHYGADKVEVGIGSLDAETWKEGSTTICRNARNSASGMETPGELLVDYDYLVFNSGFYRNGVVDADTMKTDRFAWIMNHSSRGNTGVWSRASGKNSGLPFIADEQYLPIFAIRFADFGEYTAIDRSDEDAVYVYTDYQHKLSDTDIRAMQDKLYESMFWDGDVTLDPNTVYTEEYTYRLKLVSEDIDIKFDLSDLDTSRTDYYVSTVYQDVPVPYDVNEDYGRYIYLPKIYGQTALSSSKLEIVGWTMDSERNGCWGKNQGDCDTTKSGWLYNELDDRLVIDAMKNHYYVAASNGKNASITLYPVWRGEADYGMEIMLMICYDSREDHSDDPDWDRKRCSEYNDAVEAVFSQTFTMGGEAYTWYHRLRPDKDENSGGVVRPTLAMFTTAEANLTFDMDLNIKKNENYAMTSFTGPTIASGTSYDESTGKFHVLSVSGSYAAYFWIEVTKGKYYVTFDLNTPESSYENLYFPSEASSLDSLMFGESGQTNRFWEPYRSDKCFYGWSTKKNSPDDILYDVNLDYAIETLSSKKSAPTPLYAYWQECSGTPETFVALKGNDEDLVIAVKQKFGGREYTHYVTREGISLGASAYEFYVDTANTVVPQGYVLRDVSVYYSFTDWDGNPHGPTELTVGKDGNFIVMPMAAQGESSPAFTTYTFGAEVRLAPTHLVFNTGKTDTLYYGEDWKKESDYELGEEETPLPVYVYSSEKCLVGWAVSDSAETVYTAFGPMLREELQNRGELVARWSANTDSCAGAFIRVGVEQENGKIQLVEKAGGKTVSHTFAADGTMLLPLEMKGDSLTVRSVAGLGYVLDSLVVLRGDEVVAVLHEGDVLPSSLEKLALRAYFTSGEVVPVEFAKSEFLQSGNMIRLDFMLREFDVPSGVSAQVKVVDLSKNEAVIDSVLSKSVTKGYRDVVTLRIKNPGDFRVLLTISGVEKIAEYSKTFSVKAVIASAPAESWQMLSLSAVDTSAIVWDDDPRFYWWDEDGYGTFWQYKAFEKGDSVISTRGMWYSSLEGRPLVMRSDVEDLEEDAVWNMDSTLSGWNLMANNHGWVVDLWAGHSIENNELENESEVTFWRYDAETADYQETRYARPYEAVWAKVSRKMDWNVSAEPVFISEDSLEMGGLKKTGSLAKAAGREHWTLQAVLSDAKGKRDSWNIMGVGAHPFVAEEPPASIGDHVKFAIVDGKNSFAKSVKAPADEREWTVSLSASTDREGFLTISGIDGVKAYGYHVYVTVDGNTTEMEEGVPLNVMLKSSATTATIRVAPSARVMAKNFLKGLRAARLGNRLQVQFEASEGLAGTNASVDLMDLRGHTISTVSAQAVAGKNALVLDAPKAGLYVVRVRAATQQQSAKLVVR